MPDLDNSQYEFLKKLSTRQLEALLRADYDEFEAGGNPNDELVDKILEVIQQRKESENTDHSSDAKIAWERFAKENADLLDSRKVLHDKMNPSQDGMVNSSKPRRVKHSLRRKVFIAAAMIALISICAACAVQFNIFEMIGSWTKGIFHFHSAVTDADPVIQVSDEPSAVYASLDEALAAHEIFVSLPKAIPERFVLQRVDVLDLYEPVISASYATTDPDDIFIITIIRHSTVNFDGAETNETCESYSSNGEVYTLFTNQNQAVATWHLNNIELSMRGTISIDDMKAVIDSI